MTDFPKTNTLQGYPTSKNTSISWMGQVPGHWKARRIKTIFRELQERRGQKHFELLSMTRAKGLIPQSQSSTATLLAEDLSNYKVCRESDIVMNRMQAWSGMFAVPQQEGVVSPDYSVFTPTEPGEIRFFEHLFKTPILVEQFAKYSKGIGSGFNRLYSKDFGDIQVPMPPPEEQAAIVRFLDHADEQIQRYIAGKERLIALLEEERQALVHQAVTRGLDPSVRLKPSGVEWLGDIPEHWEVVPFKRRVGFREGPGIMAADFRESGVPLLRISCLCGPVATLDGCNYLDPDVVRARWSHFAIKEGDYLLSASASTGVVSLATSKVAGCVPYTGIIRALVCLATNSDAVC